VVHGMVMPSHWWKEVKRSCGRNNVSPFFAAAVMRIEGNGWTEQRIGSSPYWGPMGINQYCRVTANVLTDPISNIQVGVVALKGSSHESILKRYNHLWFKDHYIRDVLALERQLEREARLGMGLSAEVESRKAEVKSKKARRPRG
jgi:hypothetical protein